MFEGSPSWITSVELRLFLPTDRFKKCVLHIVTIETTWKASSSGERNGKLLAWLGTYSACVL